MILPYQLCHITRTPVPLSTGRSPVYIRVITARMGVISICYATIFYHKYPCTSLSSCEMPSPGLVNSIVKPEMLKRWNHLESLARCE